MMKVSDGVKKWSILLPTMPLPPTIRVAIRRKYLARLEMAKARRATMLIIGHPKSGNTWLKVMISRLYQIRFDLPASKLINTDELALRHPEIPRLAATNGYYSYEGEVGKALAAGAADNELRHKPVLLIARNPIDIAVSWYFQFTRRQSKEKQELINHFIDHPIDRKKIEMWEFVRHSDIGLPFLIQFLNTWERNIAELPNAHILKYEHLRTEPAKALRQVTDMINAGFTDDEIQQAVEFGSFDNLKKMEGSGFFKQGGMTLRNADDPNSFKVRRGKINGYHDYFNEEQVAELEALVRENLSPAFGYLTDDTASGANTALKSPQATVSQSAS
jgi:hypothetical protein